MGGRGQADGGVDLVLTRDGRTAVVQAKHWRRDVIGVPLVVPEPTVMAEPKYPACGGDMVRRIARRGPSAGSEFFGCARHPECRGTVSVRGEAVPVW